MESDHYPVVTCVEVEASKVRYRALASWKFKGGSWGAWLTALQQKCAAPSADIEVSATNFTGNIVSASIQKFP
jgi:hypothetical protein